jgi:hypothetical protein
MIYAKMLLYQYGFVFVTLALSNYKVDDSKEDRYP